MGYRDYIRAVRKYWWIVTLTFLIAVGAGALVTINTQKQYATTVAFFVKTPSDQLSVAAQGDTFGQKRVNSYVQLATTDRLLKPVLAETKIPLTPGQLAQEIKASGDLNTVLLTITVTDASPERSLQIGTSIATQFVTVVTSLESATSGGDSTVRLELVSGPNLNPAPVAPRPALNYSIAVVLGLLLGLAFAILRELLDTTVRSSLALERATSTSVIGVIPFDDTAKTSPLIVDSHAKSIRAEAFRQLRTNLEFVHVDSPVKVVVVTSSVSEEGKSSTATNLAVIFAEAGRNVLLIEGDLRRPRVAEYLGLEGSIGLTNVLAGQVDISDVLQPWGRGGLTVLPSGSVPPNPSELLGSNNMRNLLGAMSLKFDIILIDTPPMLPVTDAAVIAAKADGAILVVRYGSTSRHQVEMASSALAKVDARLLGSVLNMAPMKGADAYSYGYGYDDYSNSSSSRDTMHGAEADAARQNLTGDHHRPDDANGNRPDLLKPASAVAGRLRLTPQQTFPSN